MKPTDKQQGWFWTQLGWKSDVKLYENSLTEGVVGEPFEVEFWYPPDDPDEGQELPDMEGIEFLGYLFKYAVPKALDVIQKRRIWTRCQAEHFLFDHWLELLKTNEYATALFWAINKVLGGKEC